MLLASLTRSILVQNTPELVVKDDAAFKDPLPPEVRKRTLASKARTDFQVGLFAKRLHRRASAAMKQSQAERDQRRTMAFKNQVGSD